MELEPANKRFRTHSPSFNDVRKINSITDKQGLQNYPIINTAVKPSFTPNRKIILAAVTTFIALAIVSSVTAIVILFLASGDTKVHQGEQTGGRTSPSYVQTGSTSGTTVQQTRDASTSTISPIVVPIGVWTEWRNWTSCAVTCGEGIQTRYRTCQRNMSIDIVCSGDYVERQTCLSGDCPVYGKWTIWSSWSGCTDSCGEGSQSRTRLCQKSLFDLDCVGDDTQSRACNVFNCPDCSQTCSSGTLSADCDRCECLMTVASRVVDRDNFPLSGVTVAEAAIPYKILAETGSSGSFTLNSTCPGTEVVLRKEKYQDKIVIDFSRNAAITMEYIVLPFIISHPHSKYRLSGENCTLCCTAGGSPDISYYEWFKNGVLLDTSLYPDGSTLILSNLSFRDSGQYNCRANSPVGSVQSESATVSVRGTSDEFCADAYQQKLQTLPEDCIQPDTSTALYEVGQCVSKSCRLDNSSSQEQCREAATSCCGVSSYRTVTVNCTGYQITLAVVMGCSCQSCNTEKVNIKGTAAGIDSHIPMEYGEIWVNGEFETETNSLGEFYLSVSSDVRKLTITAKDTYYNQFLDTSRVFVIPEDLSGTFPVAIWMFRASNPIKISSSAENIIYLGNSSNSYTASVAEIAVPSNSFIYPDGSQYNGTVSARLTFLDPTNLTILENIPGVFQFTDNEGNSQDLDTLGVFGLFFQDDSGNRLTINGAIDMYLSSDIIASDPDAVSTYKIWGLSETTGKWEAIYTNGESKKRTRRQMNMWIGEVDVGSYTWYNIDKFRDETEYCYFKTRVYDSYNLSSGSEIYMSQNGISLRFPIFRGSSVADLYGYTNYPRAECHLAICDGDSGYLELFYTDWNTYRSLTLIPANPIIHKNIGMDSNAQIRVNYNISKNGRILRLKFSASSDGPFYDSRQTCINSDSSANHFRFHFQSSNPDIFTFWKQLSSKPNLSAAELEYVAGRVWYPEYSNNRFKVCYIKISLQSQFWGDPIKLRVMNYGGTHALLKGFLYGIREVQFLSNGIACIEFKCSGRLHWRFQGSDITKIQIIPVTSPSISCTISVDNLAKERNDNINNVGLSVYENLVPDDNDESIGIFEEKTDSSQIISAGQDAASLCAVNGNQAVSFTCS